VKGGGVLLCSAWVEDGLLLEAAAALLKRCARACIQTYRQAYRQACMLLPSRGLMGGAAPVCERVCVCASISVCFLRFQGGRRGAGLCVHPLRGQRPDPGLRRRTQGGSAGCCCCYVSDLLGGPSAAAGAGCLCLRLSVQPVPPITNTTPPHTPQAGLRALPWGWPPSGPPHTAAQRVGECSGSGCLCVCVGSGCVWRDTASVTSTVHPSVARHFCFR
jgi:hypothetical protein